MESGDLSSAEETDCGGLASPTASFRLQVRRALTSPRALRFCLRDNIRAWSLDAERRSAPVEPRALRRFGRSPRPQPSGPRRRNPRCCGVSERPSVGAGAGKTGSSSGPGSYRVRRRVRCRPESPQPVSREPSLKL